MVCRNCGKPLPKGAKVCPDCGTRVPGRRWLWGSVTVVLLVLLCSAALIFFNLRSRSELPELSLKGLRGVFSAERQTPDEPPVEEAEPVAEIEAVAEPEPVEEPVETAALEDTTVLDAAFEEPEPVDLSALSDLDYYRAVETRGFTAWSERRASRRSARLVRHPSGAHERRADALRAASPLRSRLAQGRLPRL